MRTVLLLLLALCPSAVRAQAPADTLRKVPATPAGFVALCPQPGLASEGAHDLELRGTDVRARRGLQLVAQAFEAVQTAPAEGYRRASADAPAALPAGAGNGWYGYDPDAHVLYPLAERTLLVETGSGRVAKVAVLSYYHSGTGEPRVYTLRVACAAPGGAF